MSDNLQDELITPKRCSQCQEVTHADADFCVHCGAEMSDPTVRGPVDASPDTRSLHRNDGDNLNKDNVSETVSSFQASQAVVESEGKTPPSSTDDLSNEDAEKIPNEPDSGDSITRNEPEICMIRVKKQVSDGSYQEVSEEELKEKCRQAQSSTSHTVRDVFNCPFDKNDIITLAMNGEETSIRLVELAFSSQLACGFFAEEYHGSRKDKIVVKKESLGNHSSYSYRKAPNNYFFEVYCSGKVPIENLSASQSQLFRIPVGKGTYCGKPFRVYDEADSLSLETYVEYSNHRLSFNQIVNLFRAILDLVICAHSQDSLIFGISPWTVRILTDSSSTSSCRDQHYDHPPQVDDPSSRETQKLNISEYDEILSEEISKELVDNIKIDEIDDMNDFKGFDEDDPEEAIVTFDTSRDAVPLDSNKATIDNFSEEIEKSLEDSLNHQISIDSFSEAEESLTVELDRSDFGGAQSNLRRSRSNPSTPNPNEPGMRAIFDGLETLYPMGEMPDSIPLITGFAASEFLLGVTQMVGPQADIFSLGALLFYLVTGEVPPSSIHTRYSPALPMRNFRPDFPPGLEAVVHRATKIDPLERYSTVRQMRNDFEHAIAQIEQRQVDSKSEKNFSVVRAAVDKHIGIAKSKRMPVNQDHVYCAVVETGRLALVVVADGVTRATYGRGDIASKYVTEAAENIWKEVEERYFDEHIFDARGTIQKILEAANERLIEYVNEHYYPFSGGLHEVMGSTVLIACVEDGHVTLGTLGDSRAYLYTDIGLEQLTVDHNLWTLNVLEGSMPIERVRAMPYAEALARCIGSFKVVNERLESIPPEPDIHQFYLRNGDRLLLTTDGLTDYAGINRDTVEDAIHSVLRRESDPALAVLELILVANRGGGGDNIGVGLIDFH